MDPSLQVLKRVLQVAEILKRDNIKRLCLCLK